MTWKTVQNQREKEVWQVKLSEDQINKCSGIVSTILQSVIKSMEQQFHLRASWQAINYQQHLANFNENTDTLYM